MEVVFERAAGLDVHKKTVVACVRIVSPGSDPPQSRFRTFETMTDGLRMLVDWLAAGIDPERSTSRSRSRVGSERSIGGSNHCGRASAVNTKSHTIPRTTRGTLCPPASSPDAAPAAWSRYRKGTRTAACVWARGGTNHRTISGNGNNQKTQ